MNESRPSADTGSVSEPFAVDVVPWEEQSHGARFGTRFRQLGQHGGCSHVGVCMEELAPGKQNYPIHYHMLEEEHLLVLEGRATLRLADQTYALSPGSYVCIPAGQRAGHALVNTGDLSCRYLIVGERNPHEVIVHTDSGRVGVRPTGESYRKAATMEYWEGEDA